MALLVLGMATSPARGTGRLQWSPASGGLGLQVYELLLNSEFLSLQVLQADVILGRTLEFRSNRDIEFTVTLVELLDTTLD